MLVKDLRKALKKMPGEMNVYSVEGAGFASAKHVFKMNLSTVEQCCEIRTYFEEHTEDMLDSKIERETGFRNRDELIEDYKKLKSENVES